jgi:hypothetical protein
MLGPYAVTKAIVQRACPVQDKCIWTGVSHDNLRNRILVFALRHMTSAHTFLKHGAAREGELSLNLKYAQLQLTDIGHD